jgi:CHAT domain-containing protein
VNRRLLLSAGLLVVVVVAAAMLAAGVRRRAAPAEGAQGHPTLRDGVTLEVELPAGASRRYSVPVGAGRYQRLEVVQHGVDAILRLFTPDGSLLVESDGVNGLAGPESVSLVTDHAAVYVLQVDAVETASPAEPGRITLRVAERGGATPRNRRRVAADRRAAAGRKLYFERTPESFDRGRLELAAAASEFRGLDDAAGEADALVALASLENELERIEETLPPLDRALDLAHSLDDPRLEAEARWLRGWSYWLLGDWRLAVEDLVRARALFNQLGDAAREARTLCRLAAPYLEMGDTRRGREYAEAAVEVARPLRGSKELSEALNMLSSSFLFQGDPRSAAPLLEESLAIARRRGDRETETGNLVSMGVCLRLLGRLEEARERLGEALAIARGWGGLYAEATILEQLARTYESAPDDETRGELYRRSLEVSRAAGYPRGVASSLTRLARASLVGGDLGGASALIEEAIAVRERQWRLAPTATLQASYLAEQYRTYELYLEVLAARDRAGLDPRAAATAFTVADGARARSLRQELGRARVELAGEVPQPLLDRRRELGRALLAAESARRRGPTNDGTLESLEAALRRVEREIAEASPRWAGLMLPEAITVDELQRDLLDPDTVLLEYALGGERSWVFAVGPPEFSMHELPARAAIDTAARAVAEAVVARNQRVRFETADERLERVAAADAAFATAAGALSEMVLRPVAAEIAGRRVALVADGALHYVPFAALPDPRTREPLALAHEIVELPSASALREIRRARQSQAAPRATLAVLADPVLRADDPRLDRGWRPSLASLAAVAPAAPGRARTAEEQWPDLPYARAEAEAILAMVPVTDRLGAFGFDASRATAASDQLARYRFVHFATHVRLESEQPDGAGIVLSSFDARGREQDGLLTRFDVYDLRLDADLVVLSGCRTALGREIRGEGMVGLTRGFMYAGAPRVVVSLWDVDDRATAELMKRMYSRLLLGGERPAAALRAAQQELAATTEWSAPYHWAGFVLQGDWR